MEDPSCERLALLGYLSLLRSVALTWVCPENCLKHLSTHWEFRYVARPRARSRSNGPGQHDGSSSGGSRSRTDRPRQTTGR